MDSQGELSTGEAFQGDDFTSNLVPLIHKYFESEGKAEERGEGSVHYHMQESNSFHHQSGK